jgi:hypothetical protein
VRGVVAILVADVKDDEIRIVKVLSEPGGRDDERLARTGDGEEKGK